MIHHFGILQPPTTQRVNGQRPLFGGAEPAPADSLSRLERDAAILGAGWSGIDPGASPDEANERPRFVHMVLPLYL